MEYCDRVIMSEMVKTLIISPDSIKGNTPIDDYKLRAILNQKFIDPENIISITTTRIGNDDEGLIVFYKK